jgi:hypothetical protein
MNDELDRWHVPERSEERGHDEKNHALRCAQGRATPPPLQFGIRTLLAATAALALLLSAGRWIDASPQAMIVVAAIVALAAVAAIALAASLGRME